MLERYIIPLAPYALLAAGCIFALFFLLTFEKEIRSLKARLAGRQAGDNAFARDLKRQLSELAERLRDAEERAGIPIAPPSPKPSLNLNKRTQVLRMSRRGERTENIAASLSLPRREVELLLKIHALVLSASNEKPAAKATG
jgi:DNA-binding NarL/FixJ family response regulator